MAFRIRPQQAPVRLPITLTRRDGLRLDLVAPGQDSAYAMVIRRFQDGGFDQELQPLTLRGQSVEEQAWSLQSTQGMDGVRAMMLVLPGAALSSQAVGRNLRSLSIQVMGHRLLNPGDGFSGGVDVECLPPQAAAPARVRQRISLWFPELLGQRFAGAGRLLPSVSGQEHPILLLELRLGAASPLPPALAPDWNPAEFANAHIHFQATTGSALLGRIQGGCFRKANGQCSHWFGGGIGLRRAGFRAGAEAELKANTDFGDGWVFFLSGASESFYSPSGGIVEFAAGTLSCGSPALQRLRQLNQRRGIPAYRLEEIALRALADLAAELEGLPSSLPKGNDQNWELRCEGFEMLHGKALDILEAFAQDNPKIKAPGHPERVLTEFITRQSTITQ